MTGTLASELADGALSFARAHHYTVVDRPRVDLLADPTIERTDIRVDARFAEAVPGRGGHGPAAAMPRRAIADRRARSDRDPRLSPCPGRAAPRAVLRVTDPDGRTREVVDRGRQPDHRPRDRQRLRRRSTGGSRGTTAGSSAGAGRWSTRTSAAPTGRGSTASRVAEVVLGVGDRLEVGDTALVVEVAGAPD